MELLENVVLPLMEKVVENSEPVMVVNDGEMTTLYYASHPVMFTVLRNREGEIFFVTAELLRTHEGRMANAVVDAEGGLSIRAIDKTFPVDPILQKDVYDSIVKSYEKVLKKTR